jgi:alkyldihydroxyacetonephosphate synthase
MKRWNDWGNENSEYITELTDDLKMVLEALLGPSKPLPQAVLSDICKQVPCSRLPSHPLVLQDEDIRVRHARGHSFPDWLAMRYGQIGVFPDGVALPETADQVKELLGYAVENDIVVIPYGGGTSVVGHINPVASDKPILTIDMGKMDQLIDFDLQSQIATFGAGTPGPAVEAQLKEKGFTLGHYPQSWELSTVGGWIASRSSGQQSLRYGRIEQMFAGGSIETLAGTLEIPTIPASSAGPSVSEMILGSEGRMGVITEAKVRVKPLPEHETFHVVFFPSWEEGLNCVQQLAQRGIQLSMLRLSNALETTSLLIMGGHPLEELDQMLASNDIGEGKVMMTFGLTGNKDQCAASKLFTQQCYQQFGGVDGGDELGDRWEHGRFRAPYLREPLGNAGYVVDTMETCLDWGKVSNAVDSIEQAIGGALADENESVYVYTHLSHVYSQGSSVYTTYLYRCCDSHDETYKRWLKLKTAGANQIVALGGTISHQHGVGADHRDYLAAEKGQLGIDAIRSVCDIFDPQQLMNPGKLLPDAHN